MPVLIQVSFCGPAEGAELFWNSYLKQSRETFKRENPEKYWHANKLCLQQNLALAERIFMGIDGLKMSCGEFLACWHARAPAQEQ